jgi:hypothetical protein
MNRRATTPPLKNGAGCVPVISLTRFLSAVLDQPHGRRLLSRGHFNVDRKLVETWARIEELPPKG